MFKLKSNYSPKGDQPEAIKKISDNIKNGNKHNLLLGVTGSGKTFTMANIIAEVKKPVLIISHNKTLAAQLYDEFKQFFPENAVEYFVSFYDYYQPEAYIPSSDTYIEKDSDINEEIDRLRLSATSSLLSRKDTIIVASVSCIYGLGSPLDYENQVLDLEINKEINRKKMLIQLVNMQYSRNDISPGRGQFRVAGDIIEIYLAYTKKIIRISFFGDTVEKLEILNIVTKNVERSVSKEFVFPAKHFMTTPENLERAITDIRDELDEQLKIFYKEKKLLEAQRIQQRTEYDIEMLREMNYCNGIENYSRHLSGRKSGSTPYTLFDYFPKDFLTIIDESHATIPQIRAMFNGDYARKKTLVDFGFRLPSALDNRPLKFPEFKNKVNDVLYVSATPADYEVEKCKNFVVEQIIRPTGLLDPEITVKSADTQIDDVIEEINKTIDQKQRVLVTTLTIKMAEQLTDYLKKIGIKVQYLHSKIDTLERITIINSLRKGEFDVLVGINLLREGLDLPEVSLVAILDADKEGFLRSERSLIQVSGRASRNVNGRVIMYANKITVSMKKAIEITALRRKKQIKFNEINNIKPVSVRRNIFNDSKLLNIKEINKINETKKDIKKSKKLIEQLKKEMLEAAENLQFEKAAELRDLINELKNAR